MAADHHMIELSADSSKWARGSGQVDGLALLRQARLANTGVGLSGVPSAHGADAPGDAVGDLPARAVPLVLARPGNVPPWRSSCAKLGRRGLGTAPRAFAGARLAGTGRAGAGDHRTAVRVHG